MRILVTIYYGLGKGGAEVSTQLLCKEMQKRGHDIIIASSGVYEGFKCYRVPDFKKYPLYEFYVLALQKKLEKIIKQEKIDLVYAQDLNTTKGAILAAKKRGRKVVVHIRDNWFLCPKSSCMEKDSFQPKICAISCILKGQPFWRWAWDFQRLHHLRSCRPLLNKVNRIFILNEMTQQKLQEVGIFAPSVNLHNFRDVAFFSQKMDVRAFKSELGIEGKKIITYVGSFSYIKGFFFLLPIMKEILSKHSDIVFLVVGEGAGKSALLHLKNVISLGWVSYEKMPLVYQSSDVVVMPTLLWEPYGTVQIEAAASGVVVVGGNVGGVREGKFGVHLAPKRHDVWVDAIERLLADASLRKELGKKGQEYVSKHLDVKMYVDYLEKELGEL